MRRNVFLVVAVLMEQMNTRRTLSDVRTWTDSS